MQGLLAILIAASLCLGIILLVFQRRLSGLSLPRLASAVLAVAAWLLLPQAGMGKSLVFQWFPTAGLIGLDLAAPGIYLATATFSCGALVQLGAKRSPDSGLGIGYWPGLAFLLYGLTAAGLTLDHFLARYVVLELVTLGLMGAFLIDTPTFRGVPLWIRYLQFRLGDLGLMAVILLMYSRAGTFYISTMLSQATTLPWELKLPIAIGGLLAVWVKLGLPPFHGWVKDVERMPWDRSMLLGGISLPLLGAYLFYRLEALFLTWQPWRPFAAITGIAVLLWFIAYQGRRAAQQEAPRAAHWLVMHGIGLLLASSMGATRLYLLTWIPVRLFLCFIGYRQATAPAPECGSAAYPIPTPFRWLLSLSEWTSIGEGALEAMNIRIARALRHASGLADLFETGLDGLNLWLARTAHSMGLSLQQHHDGRLRRNLLWAMVGVVGLIVIALIVWI